MLVTVLAILITNIHYLFTFASVTNISMSSTSLSPDGSELRLIMNFSLENGITEQYDSDFNLINSLNDVDHIDWFPQELCSKYKQFTDRIQDWLALVKYHPYIQGRDPRSYAKISILSGCNPVRFEFNIMFLVRWSLIQGITAVEFKKMVTDGKLIRIQPSDEDVKDKIQKLRTKEGLLTLFYHAIVYVPEQPMEQTDENSNQLKLKYGRDFGETEPLQVKVTNPLPVKN